MSAHRWGRCHPLTGQKAPMIHRHMARPNKFKWASPTKGPQDFADHNGPAQVKTHKILADHNGLAQLKAHEIALALMGRPSCRPTRF